MRRLDAPGTGVDKAPDQVPRMREIVKLLRAGPVPDAAWTPQGPGRQSQVLTWTEGGESKRHPEDHLRDLADWAEAKWLQGKMPHTALIRQGSAYSVRGPNAGRPANLGWPAHYPMEAVCDVGGCGQVVERERMDPDNLDWMHTDRMPGGTE